MLAGFKSLNKALSRSAARMRRDSSGNVAIIGAAFLSTAMILTAFAVDEGALYLEKRRIQNITDIAAIAAAANPASAEASVRQALADNGLLVINRAMSQEEMRDWRPRRTSPSRPFHDSISR